MRTHRVMRALVAALVFSVLTLVCAGVAGAARYVVVYKQDTLPGGARADVERAGGVVVASYPEIGVLVVRADGSGLREALARDGSVDGVASTASLGIELPDEPVPGTDAVDITDHAWPNAEVLSHLQWDMGQIHAPAASALAAGGKGVVVGDIDTGLDFAHPDLAPNYDPANSADCSSGAATPLAPGNDRNGHGTHTAGTIAAAANDLGVVGVAPDVRIAGIKASTDAGYFYPEMVVCAFMWAGTHGIDVVNNSYFADPYRFNCRSEAGQRAAWKAEFRAIRWAIARGVAVVAAAGNENVDLTRAGGGADGGGCPVIPVEVPGVIGVGAVGAQRQKAYYSNYGSNVISVVAPGGDGRFQPTPEGPNGVVLSTWSSDALASVPRVFLLRECKPQCGYFASLQGTSMAAPHATGVVALMLSANPALRPQQVRSLLERSATGLPCPFGPFDPGGLGLWTATCQGGTRDNSFYGHGEVDALAAVQAAAR